MHESAPKARLIDTRFAIGDQVGAGRMSSVYAAVDHASADLQVAVKILNTSHHDQVKRELFKRETDALRRLRHENIVNLRHCGWSDSEDAFYLVLDYLPHSLAAYLRDEVSKPPLANLQPYGVMRDLAAALAHAHAEGIVHRDIKPSNILFDAHGRPMLTDFGISKLLTRLTVGETLAQYWSSGYASPEQRAAQSVSPSSDIYSLGAVFYYLLSKSEPPPDGPTPSMVDDDVRHPMPIRNVLKKMLSDTPGSRFSTGAELSIALEVTRRFEILPQYYLVLTRTAIAGLVSAGLGAATNMDAVCDLPTEDLGGMELDEVHVRLDRDEDLIVLGNSLRLICTRNEEDTALVVKAVETPYTPLLDRERDRSMPHRAMWTALEARKSSELSGSVSRERDALSDLWAQLKRYETVEAVAHDRKRSRRDFIERWNRALRDSRERLNRGAPNLRYTAFTEEHDFYRFSLSEFPPDNLSWNDDTRLAVRDGAQARLFPVGNFIDVRGRTVRVGKDVRRGGDLGDDELALPRRGVLTINVTEALTANSRQRQAVSTFLGGDMVNPNLADVITDPATATQVTIPKMEYFQDWLSDDKKKAVAAAVSANELFLIQGPPGTGKTSVIAEIVLQILKRDPDTRILLTSQSNVAVDHALTQIAKAGRDASPEMVRFGRPEKIGEGGRTWTVKARLRRWRREVLKRCERVLEDVGREEREARAAAKGAASSAPEDTTHAETLEEWIGEAKELAETLQEYEQERAALPEDSAEEVKDAVGGATDRARSA